MKAFAVAPEVKTILLSVPLVPGVPPRIKLRVAPVVRAASELKVSPTVCAAVRVTCTVPSPAEKVSVLRLWALAPTAVVLS